MDIAINLVRSANKVLSDYVIVFLLVGCGLYFSVKTRFVQVRCLGEGFRTLFSGFRLSGGKQKGGMTSFQALTAAVAAQVGTGIIVGASGAILIGGPGSIFWMWVIAFFSMATMYAEATLAVKTREKTEDGSIRGGPVYYMRKAFPGRFGKILAGVFAVFAILGLGFTGAIVQSNSIADTMHNAFGIPAPVIGAAVALLCGFVFIGGVSRLASVTEKLVPLMACLYLLGGIAVILFRIRYIPETFALIFKYAFNPSAIIGGGAGYALKIAVSQGANRGLFSNEAGMGSTPHAHALANVSDPHEQGVLAMMGVFIDMYVVLTMTALVVISTLYAGDGILAHGFAEGVNSANMAQLAYGTLFGESFGGIFVAVCLFFFAFSTIISWNMFGKINYLYLFGKKTWLLYAALSVCAVFAGSLLGNGIVWDLATLFSDLLVLPNAAALLMLSSLVTGKRQDGICADKMPSEMTK